MELKTAATVGTLESSDAMITLMPNPGKGISLELESSVKAIFGKAITETIINTLNEFDVTDGFVRVIDKGALDHTLRARMQAAIFRAAGVPFDWSRED